MLENHFQALLGALLGQLEDSLALISTLDHLIDSILVMLALGSKSNRARVAREIAAIGFCTTEQTHFHGVRLHLIARRRNKQLPVPARLWTGRGNIHDWTALCTQSDLPANISLFSDKAHADRRFKNLLRLQNINLLTPIKKPEGGKLSKTERHFNKLVSKIRQPIESFFKWLIDKTDIQRASSVRSTVGLLIHCLGKLSFAPLLLNFYH